MNLEREVLSNIGFKVRGVIKEPVSIEESMLYDLYNAMGCISETLVEESKMHISKDKALDEIKEVLDKISF